MNTALRWMTCACMTGVLGLAVTGCKSGDAATDKTDNNGMMNSMSDKKDIIETATGPNMQDVSTLVKAVQAAGLVDTLKGPGPFTVFAPTNEAFNKLPAGTVDDLLKPENKEKLKSILLYHVHVGDAIMAKDAKTMELSTQEGQPLNVKVEGGSVMVNNAKVIKPNIVCSNGVIHWIDTVVMPPQM